MSCFTDALPVEMCSFILIKQAADVCLTLRHLNNKDQLVQIYLR
jgi:hypothetical protein